MIELLAINDNARVGKRGVQTEPGLRLSSQNRAGFTEDRAAASGENVNHDETEGICTDLLSWQDSLGAEDRVWEVTVIFSSWWHSVGRQEVG